MALYLALYRLLLALEGLEEKYCRGAGIWGDEGATLQGLFYWAL